MVIFTKFLMFCFLVSSFIKNVLRDDLFAKFCFVKQNYLELLKIIPKQFWQNLWQKLPQIEQIKAEFRSCKEDIF